MYEQVEKPKESIGKSVANSVAWTKNNGKQCFGFVDNRTEAVAQRKLQVDMEASQQVTQLASSMVLEGENIVDTDVHINQFTHQRAAVHAWARGKVLEIGAFRNVPGGTVCNHHWGYTNIQQAFLDRNVIGKSIKYAANSTLITYGALDGLTVMNAGHRASLETARDKDEIGRNNFIDAMNYCIYKICDYPNNLFFWPDHTGAEPDYPVSVITSTNPGLNGWDFYTEDDGTEDDAGERFSEETERIEEGKIELEMAIA